MIIKNIKINQFGNLENKDIELSTFNVIYGRNEAGKSTLLSFIPSMLYGLSKLKNGKKYSDFEKYKPWKEKDFSGTIEYSLDDGTNFKVYRDFNKKSPIIYDDFGEDISKKYTVDKTKGNEFFYEQTNIDRDTLLSTVITEQKEIEIEPNIQNRLLQKIANLSESGEEEISYKSAIAKLDKLYLDEIGTDRTREKPINIAEQNIRKYEDEIQEINGVKDFKYKVEERREEINDRLEEEKQKLERLEEEQENAYKKGIEIEKQKVKRSIKEDNNKKILIGLAIVLMIASIIIYVLLKSMALTLIIGVIGIIVGIIAVIKKKEVMGDEIDVSNNSKNLRDIIENSKKEVNKLELELHKLELDEKNIEPKLDRLMQCEENLNANQEKLEELKKNAKIYKITKELMQEAYQEMKRNVTPKFNENLSKNISKISNKDYNKVILGDEIKVELEDGQFIEIDKLSVGTVEQIYLAMRLSTINELSKEQMPIILDEAFAYYDDERLEEALTFLASLNRQVILLTCTNREEKILKQINIDYNLIKL